jgi:ribosomal protein S18 acetylase RimI-like enzyme
VGILAVAVIRPARPTDWGSDSFRTAFMARGCSVFEQGGEVLGYVALEYSFYGNGFVSHLFVREEARRAGVGEALLRHAMAACRTPKLFTSTNLSNAPMQGLLRKLGFVLCGVIHELDPGDPELVYVRVASE